MTTTKLHRGMYRATGVQIGSHSIVNRDVLLDGRLSLTIGDNVSISEGVAIFTLEHDPNNVYARLSQILRLIW